MKIRSLSCRLTSAFARIYIIDFDWFTYGYYKRRFLIGSDFNLCRIDKFKMAAESNRIALLWEKATQEVCNRFGLTSLYAEQSEALCNFFDKKDVFVNLPTCYGKSIIFQAVPIMADVLYRRSKNTSIVVVISPLKSLMEDQVRFLKRLDIPAVAVTEEHDDRLVQEIINGDYTHVYGSPECLLTSTWRGIFASKKFRESLVCVAVDEAHCISQW